MLVVHHLVCVTCSCWRGGTCDLSHRTIRSAALKHSLLQVPAAQASNQSAWTQSGSSAGLPQGVGSSLCNNLYNQPCGQDITTASSPLAWIKFQVSGVQLALGPID